MKDALEIVGGEKAKEVRRSPSEDMREVKIFQGEKQGGRRG